MNFDLRSYNKTSLGQLACDAAPYADRSHNCVPRAFTAAMAMLGYVDLDPETITNFEYPQGNLDGENFASQIDFIQKHPDIYPNPPNIVIGTFTEEAARAAGEAGFPMVVSGSVACNTVLFDPNGTCGHASVLEAYIDGYWYIWNSWGGDVQVYGNTFALDSIAIFQRSVTKEGDLNETESRMLKELHAHLIQDGDIADGTAGQGSTKIHLNQILEGVKNLGTDIHSVFGTAPGVTVQGLVDHLSAQIAGQAAGSPDAAAAIARIEAALKSA